MRNRSILTVILLIAATTLSLFLRKSMTSESRKAEVKRESIDPKEAEEELTRIDSMAKSRGISSSEVETLRRALPEAQKVRFEAVDNPHQTPRSLLQFGELLGPLVEKALRSKEDAGLLMNELHDCAVSDQVFLTAQTVCLLNAEKISNAHPEFQDRILRIRKEVSPDVLELQRKMSLFSKKTQ